MADEGNIESLLRKILPNVIKATLKGSIMFLLTYLLPTLLMDTMMLPDTLLEMPSEYTTLLLAFSAIVVFFTVVTELSSGTIFQHAFGASRALVLIMYFIYALNGGVITSDFQIPGQLQFVHIFADLRAFLAVLIVLNLLGFAKSMFGAINFLAESAESAQHT